MIRLFVDRLTVIDFSCLDPARGLLGESWLCDLELAGELDAQGMVLDFAEAKRTVKRLIDERFDHRLIVPADHPGLEREERDGLLRLGFPYGTDRLVLHSGPPDAVCFLTTASVTPASLGAAIESAVRRVLPANVTAVQIRLREESIDGASYRYSHGLRRHAGNCQRIAHGHRSRIEIWRDGVRAQDLESAWAAQWEGIYVGTRADLLATQPRDGVPYCRFRYTASQGAFELELPADRCALIDTDSTVENIACHIAAALAARHTDSRLRVRAFEGVDKGAICETGAGVSG
jgi:6-pyruvoyl-tetrahydropterin synthase